jgi:hypothetical protein
MSQLQVQNGPPLNLFDLFGIGSPATTTAHFDQALRDVLSNSAFQTRSWRELQLDRDFARLRSRLSQLVKLRTGWDSYGSAPPSEEARRRAERVLDVLRTEEILPTAIAASAEGGVGICFVRGGDYADIEFLNTGEVLAIAYKGMDRPMLWEFEEHGDEAIRVGIERLRQHISE